MILTDAEPIEKQVAALERMTVGQLRERYAEVFGEPARSGNRQWLFRRVAWRIQMLAEGDLAARALERAHSRAKELARDADLRVRRPHVYTPETTIAEKLHVMLQRGSLNSRMKDFFDI